MVRQLKRIISATGTLFLLISLIVLLDAEPMEAASPGEAYFAGGCFWCVEADFEKLPGVLRAESGYAGGRGASPTYQDYSRKGHIEAVKVIYDRKKISYRELLSYFMMHINPLDSGGQFCDRGFSYSSALFYRTGAEKKLAMEAINKTEKILRRPVVTRVIKLRNFYKAEKYHQNYYRVNPLRYKYYRHGCGRDKKIKKIWKGRKLILHPMPRGVRH